LIWWRPPLRLRNQAAHVKQRLDGRVFLVSGYRGHEFARESARCGRRQKQRDNKRYGPRKVGAAVHGNKSPSDRSAAEEKVQRF